MSDLKFQDTPAPLAAPTVETIVSNLPPILGAEDSPPVLPLPEPVVENVSELSDVIIDPEVAPAAFNQADVEVDAESAYESDMSPEAPSTTGQMRGAESETVGMQDSGNKAEGIEAFAIDYWPYLLVAVTLLGWVISQLSATRDPSLRPPPRKRSKQEDQPAIENPRGQFKKAERFMKPKDKEVPEEEPPTTALPIELGVVEEAVPTEPDVPEDKQTKKQRANFMPVDQPADEDFDFELSDGGSDSDVFDLEDAAEMSEASDSAQPTVASKRFKTEDDVEASMFGVDDEVLDGEVLDGEFVSFDDQDSQLSLADSDTEFGFDLDDEDEPNGFLDSSKKVTEALTENVESVGDNLGEFGLAGVVEDAKDAVSGVAEGAQGGIAAAGAAAAGVAAVGASAAAAKGGFFSRLFGSKKNKQGNDEAMDSSVAEDEVDVDLASAAPAVAGQVDQLAEVSDDFDVPALVDDSLELEDAAGLDSVESLGDEDSDFDFDLDDDDDDVGGAPIAVEADDDLGGGFDSDVSGLDDSGELMFDLDDSNEDLAGGIEGWAEEPVAEAPSAAEIAQVEEVAVDAGELSFDLDDSDEDIAVGGLATLAEEPLAEVASAAEFTQVEEVAVDAGDSGELSFDLDDSDAEVAVSSVETLVEEPIASALAGVETETESVDDSVENDSGEFGFGLFGDEIDDEISAEVVKEDADESSDSSIAAPVLAAATAAAGLAGFGLAGTSSADTADSDRQWEAKVNGLEDQNAKLNSQVAALTRQLEETKNSEAHADSLQKEHDALSETVKSLSSEKDELLKEKELIEKEKNRLAEELEAELETAEKKSSTWEQEKADLHKHQEELKAEKEAVASELEALTTKEEESVSEVSALKSEVEALTQQRSEFESEVNDLQTKLAEAEAKPAESESGSSDDIDDLRDRFKRRLAAEHRKRKQAEQLVEEAEDQRNEVAQLLRAAKAELKKLQS